MPRLELFVLGSFTACLDGLPLTAFASNKVRALLAYLAVAPDQDHSRSALSTLFWPDQPEARARASLSQALYDLRGLLGERDGNNQAGKSNPVTIPYLMVDRENIQFNSNSDLWVDLHEFKACFQACTRHGHQEITSCDECLPRLERAARLYGGDFLAGLLLKNCREFEDWVRVEQERAKRTALQIFHDLTECHIHRGAFDAGQQLAQQQLEIDPYHDTAHRQLMRLLTLGGGRNAALAHYDQYCQVLEAELGVEPEGETTALLERIRQEEGLSPEQAVPAHNLPAFLVPLVGRKREVAEVRRQLLDPYCRLLTVVGPGGSGKTRLGIATARSLVGRFAQGIHFVPLGPIESVDALIPALANTLGLTLHEKRRAVEQLLDFLRQKDLLLVLDRFEGLLSGTDLVVEMLAAAPALKILVTSRVRLNVQEEQLYPLSGLEYRSPDLRGAAAPSDAVQLFLAGARRVQPDFELNEENQTDLAEICRLVEGIPLAILLAAAWVETLPPGEILDEIRESYDLLQADWVDVPARQRSLRATFDYSWSLLDSREQDLYRGLSVFQGGFTREAGEEIIGISPPELRALMGKSLVSRSKAGRYEMHDMVRQYGTEQLEGTERHDHYHARHSAYYLDWLAGCEADLKSARQQEVLNELAAEYGNIHAAWEWAVGQGDIERLGKTINSLGLFYEMRVLYQEGAHACRLAVEMIEAEVPVADQIKTLVSIQTWQARFNRRLGNTDTALELQQGCLRRLDELPTESADARRERALLLLERGNTIYHTDLEAADSWQQESLALYRSMGDDWETANALTGLGETAQQSGRFAESIDFFEESLALFRTLDDPRGIASSLTGLAGNLFRVGRPQDGESLIRETIQLFAALDDRAGMARSQLNLVRAYIFQGRYAEVTELFEVCNPILQDLGLQYDRALLLSITLLSNGMRGNYQKAVIQSEELLPLCQKIGYPRILGVAYAGHVFAAFAKGKYDQAIEHIQKFVDTMIEVGQSEDEQAAGIGTLGGATLKSGDLDLARQHLREALQVIVEQRVIWAAGWTLPWVALYLAEIGDVERAMEFYATGTQLPMIANSHYYAEVVEKDLIAASADLPPEVIAAAKERGRAAELFPTVAEVLEKLKE